MRKPMLGLVLASPLALALAWGICHPPVLGAGDEPPAEESKPPTTWTTAVEPKPLSPQVQKGLKWLVEHQNQDGGWSQGEESPQMGHSGDTVRDKSNIADTCIAALALIRSGSSPTSGPYKDAIARAVRFVRSHIEAADSASMAVTTIQGTRVQQKLGPHIDTFMAMLLMAEVKGRMTDEPGNQAVEVALNKVLGKIKRNQKADGTWDMQAGWAPALAQFVGGKGLNRARQAGTPIAEETLARAESYAKMQVAQMDITRASGGSIATEPAGKPLAQSGGYGGLAGPGRAVSAPTATSRPISGAGTAGVELYGRAASLGVLQDSVNTNATLEKEAQKKLAEAKDDKDRDEARRTLSRFEEVKKVHRDALEATLARLDDKQFVAGFGSNGGEEFLSYMGISEALVVKGGPDWKRWDDAMTSNLNRVQNQDGSWSGHHCITGRTFCTATALLVLMADRTPVPVAAKEKEKETR
ncbi:MAG: hypothetical protein IRY99_08350 [Isosphaeraceae bacterium]|nr:hypothetical protein [Isosphaeraceae bacterium]